MRMLRIDFMRMRMQMRMFRGCGCGCEYSQHPWSSSQGLIQVFAWHGSVRVAELSRHRVHCGRTSAALAVSLGRAGAGRTRNLLGGFSNRRRVPAERPGRGGPPLGPAQAEAIHELRQAVEGSALLLRQEHHEQGSRQALRLQVLLARVGSSMPGANTGRAVAVSGATDAPGAIRAARFTRASAPSTAALGCNTLLMST
ncbi:uncharacterized protein LOC134791333 [Cydia splendana]|uniref:uncharacterized protein LOC134791333 n=1 Tax=Cydia splendana TaxID=1100963 RepID=UPI00300CDE61